MESSTDRTRRGYAAFAAGDLDAIRDMFHPQITWQVPGRSTMAGSYRGIDAVLGYFVELFTRSDGTFRAELLDCGEIAPGAVAARVRCTGVMGAGPMDTEVVTIFREDAAGRVVEVTNYSADQYAMDETDSQTPAALVRRGYAAFAAGDLAALRELLAPDVVWNVPGRSALAGSHRGIEAVLGFFGAVLERSGGTFRAELLGCAEVVPGLVCALQHTTATLPGGPLDTTAVNVFRIEAGRAVEVTEHQADGYAYDAAVGAAITLPDARRESAPVTT